MTTTESNLETIQSIEEDRKVHLYHVELSDALKRLMDNPDFQLVIQEAYLTNEPKTLTSLLANTSMEPQVNLHLRNLHSVGAFRNFLGKVMMQGNQSKYWLQQSEDELVRIYKAQEEELV